MGWRCGLYDPSHQELQPTRAQRHEDDDGRSTA